MDYEKAFKYFQKGALHGRIASLLDGIGVKENPKSALVCLQKAEVFLYNMIENGNDMYWENYQKAIELQRKARDMMQEALKRRWDK